MPCKGLCERHRADKQKIGTNKIGKPIFGYYGTAYDVRRCTLCSIFIHFQGTHCPCCGMKTRMIPRSHKYKPRAYAAQHRLRNN